MISQPNTVLKPALLASTVSYQPLNLDKSVLNSTEDDIHIYEPLCVRLLKNNKGNSLIYNRLIEGKCQSPTNSQTEWLLDCNLLNNDSFDWKPAYLMAKRCTKSTKFNYKLNFSLSFSTDACQPISFYTESVERRKMRVVLFVMDLKRP